MILMFPVMLGPQQLFGGLMPCHVHMTLTALGCLPGFWFILPPP